MERLVPSQYATIQAAVDDCNDGDVIIVAWGTYTADANHDVDFKGKAVTVRTIDPNDPNMMAVTVIYGRGPEMQAQVGTGQSDVSMFRANAQRTGIYKSRPVRRFGRVKWKFQGDGEPYMDPVVGEGLVYWPTQVYRTDCLYAVDAETGQQRWKFQTKTRGSYKGGSAPAIANGSVYFGSYDKYFYALDAQMGLIRWKRKLGQGYSPAVVGKTVYFTTAFGYLYALDAVNGEVKWRQGSNVRSSPAVASGGVFYSGRDSVTGEGFVCKVSAETGEECWTKGINGKTPCVGNGVVYIETWPKKQLSALDEATGEIKWSFTAPDKLVSIPYGPVYTGDSSPAVAEGIVCFGGGTRPFYALDINSRTLKWKNKARVFGSPAVAEGVVYFGCLGDKLHAVDIESGEVLWQFNAERNIEASPVVSNGVVYFVDEGCNLYAIEGASR